jgi:hypothetical protein
MKTQYFIELWYRHYWWVSVLASLVLGALVHLLVFGSKPLDQPQLSVYAGVVAGYFGLIFFVQKQKLEQDRFVKELFVFFNGRYDELRTLLDEVLNADIVGKHHKLPLERYFNLCAEEYYFWQAGRIPTMVWASWREGMRFYLEKPHILAYAKNEITDPSYYGLAAELGLSRNTSNASFSH